MKKVLIAAAIFGAIGVAVFVATTLGKPAPAASAPVGPVTTEAKKGSVSVVVEGASVVEAFQQVTLRAQTPALLTFIKRGGAKVDAGGAVATMDNTTARNNLNQAELLLSQAELDAKKAGLSLERSRKDASDTKVLVDNKAAGPDKLTLAQEAVKNAEIAAETAELKVKLSRLVVERSRREVRDSVIAAPFAGTVLKTFAEPGDLLGANAQVALFGDLSRLRVSAEVDEFDISKIAIGQTATISGDSVGAEPIRSKVDFISPVAEIVNNISIFTVSAVVDNTDGRLRPGMSADFSILIKSDKGLVVPSKSISTVRGRSYLEIMENGETAKKRVEIGANDGINTVVLSGIEEGAKVVVPGAVPAAGSAAPSAPASGGEKSVLPITIPGSGGAK